jgi:hypothetical protein
MLASRILPPLLRSSSNPPVATFYNIPRRYVKSNMQVGDDSSHPSTENVDSSRNLRKSIRIQDSRIMRTSSPIHCTKEEDFPTSTSTSPCATKKRLSTSFDVEVNGRETIDSDSPIDSRAHRSASSTEYGELSEHVCLCQPEPKIPRPRNGRSYFLFISDVDIPEPSLFYVNKENGLCLRSSPPAADFFVAFILYRQHHQHAIVASNPGLANPEVSKIIGEQWQAESEYQKKIWQDLAQVCSWHALSPDPCLILGLGGESQTQRAIS